MPFRNEIHVDTLLGEVSVRYSNRNYIADMVCPVVPVKKSSNVYRVYTRDLRIPETKRANRAKANEHQFHVSTSSYNLEEHALKDYVSDKDQENYDLDSLLADTTIELTDVIMRRREKSVADLFTTSNWSLNVSLAAGAAFTLDTVASNPIPIFDTGATVIIRNGGGRPNKAILPRNSYVGAKNHQSVLDRCKYVGREVTEAILASLFGVDQLLVPEASYETTAEGATTTATIASIWGNSSWLGYVAPAPGPKVPSALYCFERKMERVRRWRDDETKSEAVEVQMEFQPKVVSSLSGYLIKASE